ncbi:helix-turn-helix domain containing protein [Phenylobacterium sp. LjRoot225]|uniref:TetR/AcrR family transcriptional regulator n=1 Tax=Phenylobacterium sp. LjRoot225 TaxID=3342285 RepID=UPI003ECDF317
MLRTRSALCGTLLALLEEKPFEQVTVREITRRAGVGYATFFRHYPDKEALLNDLAADQISELIDKTLPILFAADSLVASRETCAYVDARRKLWSALLTGGAAGTVRHEFIRQAKLIAAGKPPAESWIPADLQVVYATGGTIDILAWWLQQEPALPVERIADILDRLVIAPTLARS